MQWIFYAETGPLVTANRISRAGKKVNGSAGACKPLALPTGGPPAAPISCRPMPLPRALPPRLPGIRTRHGCSFVPDGFSMGIHPMDIPAMDTPAMVALATGAHGREACVLAMGVGHGCPAIIALPGKP